MRRIGPVLLLPLALLVGCGGSGGGSTTASTPTSAPLSGPTKQKIDQANPQLGSPSQIPKSVPATSRNFGSEAPADQKAAAARVLTAYLAALSKGDTQTACALLSPLFADHLALIASHAQPGGSPADTTPNPAQCPAALAKILPRLPKDRTHLGPPRLDSLRVGAQGHAIAIFTASGKPYSMPMLRAGADWKVAALVPAPLG